MLNYHIFPPAQVPLGVDGLASLGKEIYGCSSDRTSLFSYQVAELLELRGRNSLCLLVAELQ